MSCDTLIPNEDVIDLFVGSSQARPSSTSRRVGVHEWGPSQVPAIDQSSPEGRSDAIISTARAPCLPAAVRAAMQTDMLVCQQLRISHHVSGPLLEALACAHQWTDRLHCSVRRPVRCVWRGVAFLAKFFETRALTPLQIGLITTMVRQEKPEPVH